MGVQSEGGYREVLKGLAPGEVVVTSGQFLLDSESKIKEAIQKMLARRRGGGATFPAPAAGEHGAAHAEAGPAAAFTAPGDLVPIVADVCPVMGGKPVPEVFVDHDGYRIFFCCAGCPEKFRPDPEKYLKPLREAGVLPAEEVKAVNGQDSGDGKDR